MVRDDESLAREWLVSALSDGLPHRIKNVVRDARESVFIRERTLRRAAQVLGLIPKKIANSWWWVRDRKD